MKLEEFAESNLKFYDFRLIKKETLQKKKKRKKKKENESSNVEMHSYKVLLFANSFHVEVCC